MNHNKAYRVAIVLAAGVALCWSARADMLDLSSAGASGWLNGAFFEQISPQTTGTGVIRPFVQISSNQAVAHAYNTTVNNTLDVGPSDIFNHELFLSEVPLTLVPTMNVNGELYRMFLLDINEPKNGEARLLSLDEVQIWLSDTPNQGVETFAGGSATANTGDLLDLADAALVYQLDSNLTQGNPDNWVLLDYALNEGQGSGDMFMYIPDSLFDSSAGDYVYLYSRFGENYANDSGFEEWAVLAEKGGQVVPEPASFLLLGTGLAVLIVSRKKPAAG